ncbi:hypothetical protein P4V43_10305 [Brevibacillus fortis]|uniref:hypothetical protein n=1 Tax=Brevibacillus fortis TaxID=2126352 RepID=UPI002E1FEF43|nr:hypothetical protein [Brevibacillus fortis]
MEVQGSSFLFRLLLCGCGEEKNISSLGSRLRLTGKCALSAPKALAGKRKSGNRFDVWARCVSVAR